MAFGAFGAGFANEMANDIQGKRAEQRKREDAQLDMYMKMVDQMRTDPRTRPEHIGALLEGMGSLIDQKANPSKRAGKSGMAGFMGGKDINVPSILSEVYSGARPFMGPGTETTSSFEQAPNAGVQSPMGLPDAVQAIPPMAAPAPNTTSSASLTPQSGPAKATSLANNTLPPDMRIPQPPVMDAPLVGHMRNQQGAQAAEAMSQDPTVQPMASPGLAPKPAPNVTPGTVNVNKVTRPVAPEKLPLMYTPGEQGKLEGERQGEVELAKKRADRKAILEYAEMADPSHGAVYQRIVAGGVMSSPFQGSVVYLPDPNDPNYLLGHNRDKMTGRLIPALTADGTPVRKLGHDLGGPVVDLEDPENPGTKAKFVIHPDSTRTKLGNLPMGLHFYNWEDPVTHRQEVRFTPSAVPSGGTPAPTGPIVPAPRGTAAPAPLATPPGRGQAPPPINAQPIVKPPAPGAAPAAVVPPTAAPRAANAGRGRGSLDRGSTVRESPTQQQEVAHIVDAIPSLDVAIDMLRKAGANKPFNNWQDAIKSWASTKVANELYSRFGIDPSLMGTKVSLGSVVDANSLPADTDPAVKAEWNGMLKQQVGYGEAHILKSLISGRMALPVVQMLRQHLGEIGDTPQKLLKNLLVLRKAELPTKLFVHYAAGGREDMIPPFIKQYTLNPGQGSAAYRAAVQSVEDEFRGGATPGTQGPAVPPAPPKWSNQ